MKRKIETKRGVEVMYKKVECSIMI